MLDKEKEIINKVVEQLSIMYKVDIEEIKKIGSRKENVIEARRMFNYYLFTEKDIRHYKMFMYIKGINHATSIYHVKKIKDLFTVDKELQIKYIELLYLCDTDNFYKLHKNKIFSDTMSKVFKIIK
tara:strand:- start:3856 stop:4233 length:378 start_codon:yes stop_codon:yes gene_type:complete